MTRRLLLLVLPAMLFLVSACSEQGTTIVAGNATPQETTQVETTATLSDARVVEELAEPLDPPITEPVPVGSEPRIENQGADPTPWSDRPLASVLLTLDDLPALGLGDGWTERNIDFIELEGAGEEEPICGVPAPVQTSYFVASFENRSVGAELELNVMLADEPSAATEFIDALERLATCANLEEQYGAVSLDVLPLAAAGVDHSIVIAGVDATSPSEPIGITLAAAELEAHLFIVFVVRDDGEPHRDDARLALRAIERALSRL